MEMMLRGGFRPGGGRHKGAPTKVIRLPLDVAALARRLADGSLKGGDINGFLDLESRTSMTVPLVGASVQAGFPSPAEDYLDKPLDFNELLIRNPPATFAVRVAGDSMTGAGIYPGDVAVVDRSRTPIHGCIILACVDREFTLKRYCVKGGSIILHPENEAYQDLVITEDTDFLVWGVITGTVRLF